MPVSSPPPSFPPTRADPVSERDRVWAATMHGHVAGR